MSEPLEHTIKELKGLVSHILDLKRICFDYWGDTTEGYQAHSALADMEASCYGAARWLENLREESGQ